MIWGQKQEINLTGSKNVSLFILHLQEHKFGETGDPNLLHFLEDSRDSFLTCKVDIFPGATLKQLSLKGRNDILRQRPSLPKNRI
jgi:hypothetical protein